MAASYPSSLPTTARLPTSGGVGANLSTFPHSDIHGFTNEELLAALTELGVSPSDTFSTVKARLDSLSTRMPTWHQAASIAATTSGTTTLIVATLVIPAQLFAGFVTVGAMMYRTHTVANDVFDTSIYDPTATIIATARYQVPATGSGFEHSISVIAPGLAIAAATSATYTCRLTRISGTGTSSTIANAVHGKIWAQYTPA